MPDDFLQPVKFTQICWLIRKFYRSSILCVGIEGTEEERQPKRLQPVRRMESPMDL